MRMKDKIKISPSRLEERIFVTEQELNTYLASPKAKAGQNITLLDSTILIIHIKLLVEILFQRQKHIIVKP